MTGILSQLITLTAYGNNYLAHDYLPVDFYPGNAAFGFCNKVDFVAFHKALFTEKLKETNIAKDPAGWYKYLKKDGCKKLRLYFLGANDKAGAEQHKLAGMVGGGGTWYIEAVYKNYSNFWTSGWQVTDKQAADSRIWSVSYGLAGRKQPIRNVTADPAMVKTQLGNTLAEIATFAFSQKLDYWGKVFEKATAVLNSLEPEEQYYQKGLIPPGNYSVTAKQILFAAGTAWVFGGMGSWNDLNFSNEESTDIYNKLSAQLYHGIIEAVLAAVNSY